MTRIRLLLAAAFFALLWSAEAHAHDPSAWGGVFRSRDDGARWLPVNEGRFIGGALGLAISPIDAHHLLLGTDSGLLRSRNGGRDWVVEAPNVLIGGVFATAFDADGVRALASTALGVFRSEDGITWRRTSLAKDALPARAIVRGATPGRAHLAGTNGVWRSEDWGASWTSDRDGLAEGPVGIVIALPGPSGVLYAIAGRRLWMRSDDAPSWKASDAGMAEGRVDAVAVDAGDPARLWAVAGDQLYLSEDCARTWRPFGRPFPVSNTRVRGIAVTGAAVAISLTSDRGLLRSADHGRTWALQEGMLPVHLEAGPLVRDPTDPVTLYAGFALTPYDEMWRLAVEGGTSLGRLDALSLAGGVAFLAVMALAAAAALRWLGRYYRKPDGTAAWPR